VLIGKLIYYWSTMVGSKHHEHTLLQARDSKGWFSLGGTRSPPPGLPSSCSKSNDDSSLKMWYVAPTPMQQQKIIILSSTEEDIGSRVALSHIERVWVKFNYLSPI
jgi:hypothetical protein